VRRSSGALIAPLLGIALGLAVSSAPAAEVRLAVAPKITLPNDSPVYYEDPADCYGTNIANLTSGFLRARAEAHIRKTLPSSVRVQASRVPNSSIISVTASGADESLANSFLSALAEQFLRFKHDQKAKYYRDAIDGVDSALSYAPPEYAHQLEEYKKHLVIASMLDTKPEFERVEY
jgi:hypothetical protein